MLCALSLLGTDHPAVAKTPPSSAGDVYVDRVRARMVHLLSQISLDVVHILMILANANYCSSRFLCGYRMECMTARMIQELGLHQLYTPDNAFATEIERIAFESKLRTLALCTVNDVVNSLISGLPGHFEHVLKGSPSPPSNSQDWWVERIALTGKAMEPVDDYSLGILQPILRPRRIRGGGILAHTVRLFSAAISVRHFVSRVSSLGRENAIGEVSIVTGPVHSLATALYFETQEVFHECMKLDAELEQWRASVPRELEPENAKYTVARTDVNCLQTAAVFFTLVIRLTRPFLMSACMSVINRKARTGQPGHPNEDQDPNVDPVATTRQDSTGERMLLDDQRLEACLHKCINAADEIMSIAEQFTDDDIKYRGFTYALSVFTAGTV